MHSLISFLALSAYSDDVEERWHLRHNPQSHHESNRHPSTETISVVKMLSWEWYFTLPQDRMPGAGA